VWLLGWRATHLTACSGQAWAAPWLPWPCAVCPPPAAAPLAAQAQALLLLLLLVLRLLLLLWLQTRLLLLRHQIPAG
jgi:hypothetical protein